MREYGIFEDGECLERDFYSVDSAKRCRELNYDAGAIVMELCPDHDGQPYFGCEDCDGESDDA